MKRMLDQKLIDLVKSLSPEQIAWVNQMKDNIFYDEVGEQLDFSAPVYFEGLMKLDSGISQLSDSEGNRIFPFLENQAGKFVKVNSDETGFEYGRGGTQLFVHELTFSISSTNYDLIIISLNSTQITELSEAMDVINEAIKITETNDNLQLIFNALDNNFIVIGVSNSAWRSGVEITDADTFTDVVSPL